jgi:hypothetical protein
MRRIVIATIAAACLSAAAVTAPSAFANNTPNAHCTVSQNGTTYSGNNELYYHSYSTTLWRLDNSRYDFGPANSSSVHNNQNLTFFGGSNYYNENSADSLSRDAQWHIAFDLLNNNVYGQKSKSYAQWTDIFDVPNVSDPSCSATSVSF